MRVTAISSIVFLSMFAPAAFAQTLTAEILFITLEWDVKTNEFRASLGGSLVTPIGKFSINQSVQINRNYSHIVLRDRKYGTDQYFQVPKGAKLRFRGLGEVVDVTPDDNGRFVIEVADIKKVQVEIFRTGDGQELFRTPFGFGSGDLVLMSNNVLKIEGTFSSTLMPLDSLEAIELSNVDNAKGKLVFRWKPSLGRPPEELRGKSDGHAKGCFIRLKELVPKQASGIAFVDEKCRFRWGLLTDFVLLSDGQIILDGAGADNTVKWTPKSRPLNPNFKLWSRPSSAQLEPLSAP